MRHEKIIKRADGSQVKIVVTLYTDFRIEKYNYETEVFTCQPSKRTFHCTVNEYDYRYRALSTTERAAYKDEQILKHVSADELLSAKMELWQKIKPS